LDERFLVDKFFPLTNYSITVFPRGLEPILEQPLEFSIMLAVDTSEYLHILQREFERSGFESKVSGGV